ncbi:MAG: tetratricopeptide repeat protein [Planctomycetota bacterium]
MTTGKASDNAGGTAGGAQGGGARVGIVVVAVLLIASGSIYILTRGGGGTPGTPGTPGNTSSSQTASGGADTDTTTDDGSGVADPETVQVLTSAARTRMGAGQHAEAEIMLRRGIEKYPQDQSLRGMLAEALMGQGKDAQALDAFKTALALGENADYRDFAAGLANGLGMFEEAANQWALAQNADPGNPKYPLYGAQVLRKLNRHDEARVKLVTATKLDETLHQAWAGLAGIALDNNNLDPALQNIQRARRIAPTQQLYIQLESTIRRRLGQGQRAAELLLTIDERRRFADPELMRELALCFGMIKEPDRAVDMYRDASERYPRNADIHFELALWAQRVGDLELALAASTKARELGDLRAEALLEQLRDELGA